MELIATYLPDILTVVQVARLGDPAALRNLLGVSTVAEAAANDDDLLDSSSASRPSSEPARPADQELGGSRQSELQELPAVKRRGRFVPPVEAYAP